MIKGGGGEKRNSEINYIRGWSVKEEGVMMGRRKSDEMNGKAVKERINQGQTRDEEEKGIGE